nr:hypothetical protein [Paenibacillus tritici]
MAAAVNTLDTEPILKVSLFASTPDPGVLPVTPSPLEMRTSPS